MRRWGEEGFQVTGTTGACNSGKVTPVAAKGQGKQTGVEQNGGDVNDDMTGDDAWLLQLESMLDKSIYAWSQRKEKENLIHVGHKRLQDSGAALDTYHCTFWNTVGN